MLILLPLFIFIPGFGDCSFIIISSSFAFSPNSTCKFISNPTSFKAFFASFRFKLRISGTSTSSKFSVVCSLSFLSSKYGNISPKTCPPTGAATAPPWVIITTSPYIAIKDCVWVPDNVVAYAITTQILQICYLLF